MRKNVFHTLQVRYFLQFEPHWLSISAWSMPHCNSSYTSLFSTRLQIYNFLLYLIIFCRCFFIIFVQTIVKQTNGPLAQSRMEHGTKGTTMGYATNRGEMKPKPPKNFGVLLAKGGRDILSLHPDSAGHLSILLQNISSIFPLLSEEHEKHSKKDKHQQHNKHQQHDKPMTYLHRMKRACLLSWHLHRFCALTDIWYIDEPSRGLCFVVKHSPPFAV